MPSDDIVISVRNVTKTYRIFKHPGDRIKQAITLGMHRFHKNFTALKNISFDVGRGETIGIIGRNGSGKSTLLQAICGIIKPSEGSVRTNGRISALLELGAGFNPEFTGRENVYFQGMILGLSREKINNIFAKIEQFADIGEFIDQPVRTYSSGMFVRLAFSVAIHVEPRILIVDEALGVGDAQFQAKCFEKLRQLKLQEVTILLVSHNFDLITTYCERVILLDKGALVVSETPNTAVNIYRKLLTTQTPPSALNRTTAASSHFLWSSLFHINKDENRYGSKETEIIEAGLFTVDNSPTQLFQYGDECQIKIRLLCNHENLRPSVAYVIKDLKGLVLLGTNTLIENIPLAPTQIDQIVTIVFQLPILLNPGQYLLSTGSQGFAIDGSPVAHDHRADYLEFEVMGKYRHGVFSPPIGITLEHGL